jgi:hypothetical protein
MEILMFLGVLGAVIAGNALTLLYIYALWRATKEEREHGDLFRLPFSLLLAGMAGPLVGGLSILYAVNY